MALVFKIKCNDILRRWLVSEDSNAMAFSVTLSQLEGKIRELFHVSPTASLIITYVDRENDVVTLGNDQDLVDACLVQQLNPLRLDVDVKESATQEAAAIPSSSSSEVLDPKHLSRFLGGNSKSGHLAGGLKAGSDMTAVVPPYIAVPSNARAFGAYHAFHSGVQCDGCGMNPIEGPRYKSMKVPNYDLCFACYDLIGAETDFEKLEHPSTSHGHSLFFDRLFQSPPGSTCSPSFPKVPYSWTTECPFSGQTMDLSLFHDRHKKLDAKFVKDVTIFDGTELGPGTKFTKVWRMANNGTMAWPQRTQLALIEGDALSSMEVENVELPEGGLPCGDEVEISVNLTAPDVSGQYVSHWRLVSPSGRKFGHRVWAMINVVNTSVKEEENFVNIEVNNGQDANKAFVEKGMLPVPSNLNSENVSLTDVPDMHKNGDCVVLSDQGSESVLGTEVDIELDGFSVVQKPVENFQSQRHITPTEKEVTETNVEAQLKALESLGFDNRELNLSWLENGGDVQGALENLIVCAGWEEVMRNLKEMGFDDWATNVCLLHKHRGSIKLVVKDLVKMENQKENQ